MRTRVVVMIAVWAMLVVGAVRLGGDAALAAGVGSAVLAGSLVLASRFRRRRTPIWLPALEDSELPAGPRRVLLLEAGMTGPE